MGCYPLLAGSNLEALEEDLEALRGRLVAVAFVPDPYGDFDPVRQGACLDRLVEFERLALRRRHKAPPLLRNSCASRSGSRGRGAADRPA